MEWITNQTSKMSVANVLKTIWNGKENFGFNLCLIICCFHSTYPTQISQKYLLPLLLTVKVMLPSTIRNDDFHDNTALQCWNNVVTIRNNVATILQRCVALKIVFANRLVYNITLRQMGQLW